MSVREAMNEKKGLTITIAIIIIAVMIVVIVRQTRSTAGGFATSAYYTDDDGKTFFEDSALLIPPFDHDGKQAVKAFVYDCDGTRSVHYMERYTSIGKKAAEEAFKRSNGKDIGIPEHLMRTGIEYKRPGDTTWQHNPPGPKPCPKGGRPEWITP